MGDTISRSDIQNAVDSALRDMRGEVSRISHIIDSLNRAGQDMRDMSRRLQALEQAVSQIQNTVANTLGRPATRRYPDPYVVNMMSDINNLKQRFSAVERFMGQMGEYVARRNAEDEEKQQYRNT